MYIFAILIKIIGIVAITILGLRYYTHMLQLSSYQFQGYFRFLGTIRSSFGLHVGAACSLVLAPLFMAQEKFGLYLLFDILAIVFIVMTVFLYIPKPAKKKFVVTDRVKRLFRVEF